MRRTHKIFAYIMCFILLLQLLCGCEKEKTAQVDGGFSVYASFYPFYAAAQLVCKDVPDVHLNCLVQPQDGCLRDYQLSDWDLALLSSSDLVIAGGRGLESFENILYALGSDGPAVTAVLYNTELIEQKGVNTQTDTQSHWLEANPHIYMRSDAMPGIIKCIADSLILLDSKNADLYRENLKKAVESISKLSEEIESAAAELSGKKIIVMNEALIYAAQEYGLITDLCYERESGEDLRDEDLAACLRTLEKSDAKVILIEKQAPQHLCKALIEAGYKLARMDVLSTKRANEGSDGYFDALLENVRIVKHAFNEANSPSEPQ